MDRVNELMRVGLTLPAAVKQALRERGLNMSSLAARHAVSQSIAMEVINLDRSPRPVVIRALCAELGGDPYQWARLFWAAAEPTKEEFAAIQVS